MLSWLMPSKNLTLPKLMLIRLRLILKLLQLRKLKIKPSLKPRQLHLRLRKLRLRRILMTITLRLRLKRKRLKLLMMRLSPNKRPLMRLWSLLRKLLKKLIDNRESKRRLLPSLNTMLEKKNKEKSSSMPSVMSGALAQLDSRKSNLLPILSSKLRPLFQAHLRKLWLLKSWSTSNLSAGLCSRTKTKKKIFTKQ